ncbi:MAG TPA: hypothetical protein VFW33_12285, partial [Gemmataceae bacterium]|nr:hypothetical protein [Gemmataceae bacterium]
MGPQKKAAGRAGKAGTARNPKGTAPASGGHANAPGRADLPAVADHAGQLAYWLRRLPPAPIDASNLAGTLVIATLRRPAPPPKELVMAEAHAMYQALHHLHELSPLVPPARSAPAWAAGHGPVVLDAALTLRAALDALGARWGIIELGDGFAGKITRQRQGAPEEIIAAVEHAAAVFRA